MKIPIAPPEGFPNPRENFFAVYDPDESASIHFISESDQLGDSVLVHNTLQGLFECHFPRATATEFMQWLALEAVALSFELLKQDALHNPNV